MRINVYPKLAWEGIRKNKRLYVPYIAMGALMVMMFYLLRFLQDSPVIGVMRGAVTLSAVLPMGYAVIAIFSIIFLFYTNSFLIRQRYREFGLYNILGMNKQNVCMIMVWESIFVGSIAIVTGLAAGILLSKGAELVLFNLVHMDVSFDLRISAVSVFYTITGYIIIYLILLLNSVIKVWFAKPLDLLKSNRVGEKMPKRTWVYAAVGMVLLGAAYYLAVSIKEPLTALMYFFLAVIMVIIGTYALFMAGSVVLCRILQKNKRYYYQPNHFISVSSMMYRMKRNGAGLASICILLTMVLVMLSSTTSLYFGIEDSLVGRYPHSVNVVVGFSDVEDLNSENLKKLYETVRENSPEVKETDCYTVGGTSGLFSDQGINLDVTSVDVSINDYEQVGTLQVMSLEEYNRLCDADETLNADECLLYANRITYDSDTFTIVDGPSYKVKKMLDNCVKDGDLDSMMNPSMIMVVPDFEECLKTVSGFRTQTGVTMMALRWKCGYDVESTDQETKEAEAIEESLARLSETESVDGLSFYSVDSREDNRESFYDLNGSLFFLGIVLSTVFLLAAVMIIYYKQLSEGYEDYARYEIMQKVGMTKQDIRKSINSQMLTVFFSPLLMAGLHLCFAFPFLWKIMMMFGLNNRTLIIAITVICYIIFGIFYAVVYKITSNLYFYIVSGNKRV
mgnify:FL=1